MHRDPRRRINCRRCVRSLYLVVRRLHKALSVNVSNDLFDRKYIYCSSCGHAVVVCLASSSWLDLINVKAPSNIDTLRCVSLCCNLHPRTCEKRTDDEK